MFYFSTRLLRAKTCCFQTSPLLGGMPLALLYHHWLPLSPFLRPQHSGFTSLLSQAPPQLPAPPSTMPPGPGPTPPAPLSPPLSGDDTLSSGPGSPGAAHDLSARTASSATSASAVGKNHHGEAMTRNARNLS